MGSAVHSVLANSCDSVGIRQSIAFLSETRSEKASMFLEVDPWTANSVQQR